MRFGVGNASRIGTAEKAGDPAGQGEPPHPALGQCQGVGDDVKVGEPLLEVEEHLARGADFHRLVYQHGVGIPADRQAQIRTMLATSLKGVISQTLCKKISGGRVAAMETLFVNSAIANLIREGKIYQIASTMQTSKKSGMTVLNDALFKLVCDKVVTPEEAYIKAIDKQAFAAALKSKSILIKMEGIED